MTCSALGASTSSGATRKPYRIASYRARLLLASLGRIR
jgi:hypothetical protein